MKVWFIEKLSDARTTLEQFPTLNKIFENLADYETKHHTIRKNVFVDGLFPAVKGEPKSFTLKSLQEIEKALSSLDIDNWNAEPTTELIKRITGDDRHASLSVFTELQIAYKIINRVGLDKISMYPDAENTNVSDLKISLDDIMINFEITNLNMVQPEEKIQNIFDMCLQCLACLTREFN